MGYKACTRPRTHEVEEAWIRPLRISLDLDLDLPATHFTTHCAAPTSLLNLLSSFSFSLNLSPIETEIFSFSRIRSSSSDCRVERCDDGAMLVRW